MNDTELEIKIDRIFKEENEALQDIAFVVSTINNVKRDRLLRRFVFSFMTLTGCLVAALFLLSAPQVWIAQTSITSSSLRNVDSLISLFLSGGYLAAGLLSVLAVCFASMLNAENT